MKVRVSGLFSLGLSPICLAIWVGLSLLLLATGCGTASTSRFSAQPDAAPTVTITPSAMTLSAGGSSTLTVAATNATQVTVAGSDGTVYSLQPNGGTQAVSPAATTTYTADASGAGGSASAKTTVTVKVTTQPAPAAPTVSITAGPASIGAGGSSTLSVAATNATQVMVAGSDGSSYSLPTNGGSQAVSPANTTTYTAHSTGAGGSASATATVTVVPLPPPPPPPPATPTVSIAATPATLTAGSSSTLTVAATNATQVMVSGSDGSSYVLPANGGTQAVSPATTTTYTAAATGAGGTASSAATVTVVPLPPPPPPPPAPTVSIAASPATITAGSSSTLTVAASNAAQVRVSGSDGSTYSLPANGGAQAVSPATTTTYTASATGAGGTASAAATVTVVPLPPPPPPPPAAPTVSIAASPAAITAGGSSTLTVAATNATQVLVSGSDGSSYTLAANGGSQAVSPAATTTYTAAATGAGGTASSAATVTVNAVVSPGGANILTWHFDTHRSGLNPGETALTPTNVHPATFGKLFSYLVDGYVYGEPLLVSNVTVSGASHNILYAATENDSVYAFDADKYGAGAPLWQVSLLQAGEQPLTNGPIKPFEGITSTPVIDPATNTIYVVSAQTSSSSGSTFRLNALDITTGAQKFGGPVAIHASVPATNSNAQNGIETLTNSCVQRAALLLANHTVYMGFGSCHSGWLLAYDAATLAQTGVFNASPNLNGEGKYASAGGVWMGSGGPVADDAGNVYVTTGNGPWDGQTAFADSVLKFDSTLKLLDYFTPQDYQYMDCQDADLAAGGLLMIPGTSQLLAGGKTGKMYLVNGGNLGHEQANDAGATQTLFFESDLIQPYPNSCTDSAGVNTTLVNSYEIFGTAAYFNGGVYLGITPTSATAPAGVRRFAYTGTLTPDSYTHDSAQQNTRGTTPFISANGNAAGILWMIDTGQPIQSPQTPTGAILRAFDAMDLTNELYNSAQNSGDQPGFGIKFSSPIVANGKVYISTGHDLPSTGSPQGELDVYGLK